MIIKKIIKLAKPLVEKFPHLAMTYRLIRDNNLTPTVTHITPKGFRLAGHPLMEKGLFEIEEVAIVEQLLKKVDVFVNVGANIGYYCCIALSLNKKTLAFEPIDTNLRYLYANIRANSWERDIEIFPVALGNQSGFLEIYGSGTGASLIPGWAGTPQNFRHTVPVFTLDTILGDRFAGKRILFLIDIEGYEKFMLEGSENHLKLNPKPMWLVEISTTEHQPVGISLNPYLLDTFELFWKHGYEARTANKAMRLVEEEEVIRICKTGENTFETHNFLFTEKQ